MPQRQARTQGAHEAKLPAYGELALKHRIWRKINAQAHWLLALAVLISGLWFISPLVQGVLSGTHQVWFSQNSWREVLDAIGLAQLPRVVIALSLVLMSVGLLVRARVAWIFTLVMLLPAIFIDYYTKKPAPSRPTSSTTRCCSCSCCAMAPFTVAAAWQRVRCLLYRRWLP